MSRLRLLAQPLGARWTWEEAELPKRNAANVAERMMLPLGQNDHVATREGLGALFCPALTEPLQDHNDLLHRVDMPRNGAARVDDVLMESRLLGAQYLVGKVVTQPAGRICGRLAKKVLEHWHFPAP